MWELILDGSETDCGNPTKGSSSSLSLAAES